MKGKQKGWFFRPEKLPKPKVPENIKSEVETKAKELVESFLKPNYIKPPPKDNVTIINSAISWIFMQNGIRATFISLRNTAAPLRIKK